MFPPFRSALGAICDLRSITVAQPAGNDTAFVRTASGLEFQLSGGTLYVEKSDSVICQVKR